MTSALAIAAISLIGILMALPLIYVLSVRVLNRKSLIILAILDIAASFSDTLNEKIGRGVAWLALAMVLVQTIVVLQRYVFGVNFIWMQESITYMHGTLFMLAAGFTLLHDGHVRVDIFYRESSIEKKALTNFLGTYIFLFPVMAIIWFMAFPYVELSWRIGEGSTETSGIQGVYLLKTAILAFAALMILQGISLATRSAFILTGRSEKIIDADALPPTF